MNEESCFVPGGHRIHLSFNGPFATGVRLDSRELLGAGYRACAKKLTDRISRAGHDGWSPASPPIRENDLLYDVDTYEGKTLLPHYFISYRPQADLSRLGEPHAGRVGALLEDLPGDLYFEKPRVKFHDFGTGVVAVDATFKAKADMSAAKMREIIETVSSNLAGVLNPLILECRGIFRRSIDEKLIWPREHVQLDDTPLQWMHRIYLFDCREWNEAGELLDQCRTLIPKSRPEGVVDCAIADDLLILPSIGSSLAVCTEGACDSAFRSLKRIVELQNAYWAGAFSIDSELFFELHELGKESTAQANIEELDRRYSKIMEVHEQNTLFRSALINHVCHMSPQDTLIWAELADAWQLDTLQDSVEDKLQALSELSERIIQNVSRQQEKKLNVLVLLFTLLSLATVLMDTVIFVQGPITTLSSLAFGLFVGIVLVLVLVAWRALRWTGGQNVLRKSGLAEWKRQR